MNRVVEWLTMGGYAGYVWSAYGVAFFIILFQIILMSKGQKRVMNQLKQSVNITPHPALGARSNRSINNE